MTQWFSADLHIGHRNIIRYCDRPFTDVDEMNEGLIARWNAVVAPDDEVWVLGDVAMGRIALSLPLVGRLHGTTHLLTGNHDRCWDGETGGRGADPEWVQRYLDAGFTSVVHGEIEIEVRGDSGRSAVLRACHFPYEGDSQGEDRYPDARPSDDGRWLLHGHVHETWRQHGRMINVGIDAWGGVPVSADTVLDLVAAGEHDLERVPWSATPATPRTGRP